MYRVYFYTEKSGKSPIREFINSSQKSLQSKITKQINTLQKFGLTTENPYLRKLTGTPLWESRILGKDNTRIISVALIERKIIVLNIFRKKCMQTPIKEIKLSMRRYKDLTSDI